MSEIELKILSVAEIIRRISNGELSLILPKW